MSVSPEPDGLERVLVVVAHPDDIDFVVAGTVAAWTDAGVEVAYCLATSGDAGGFDDTPRTEMAPLREKEQRAAAAEIGVGDVTFLGYPDGRLYVTHELRRDITRQIRRVRPQLVVTGSPVRNWRAIAGDHPDHMAVGEAALCAVYPDARNPFAHPELAEEGLAAWTVSRVWIVGGMVGEPHVVDVTDTFDRKLAALRAHVSQVGHRDDLEKIMREWGGRTATEGGLPEGRLAEAFGVVDTA